jgi:hypothetical protein
MKKILFILSFAILSAPAFSQNIIAAKPARLKVYGLADDGAQLVMTSDKLGITYDKLNMKGELMLNSLSTDAAVFQNLLDSAQFDRLTVSGIIPEGKFVFQNTMNSRFVVEAEMVYGDMKSRIIINYTITNNKTSSSNTFLIECTGNISLKDDLGINRRTALDDKISFQFSQNVQTKNY